MKQPRDTKGRYGEVVRDEASGVDLGLDPVLIEVLESAARLQELVPDAVLVGGSAAAYYAQHRLSHDHDHVLVDLRDRFDAVLDAMDRESEWVTNRVTPGKIILGSLGEIEAGVRQLIRKTPLEFEEVPLPSGALLRVPTIEEALRIKAFLVVKRNQVRDYLDVAALSDKLGVDRAAGILAEIDAFYADETKAGEAVATQVSRQLGDPRPKDTRSLDDLASYKGLRPRWWAWGAVREQCMVVAAHMLDNAAAERER